MNILKASIFFLAICCSSVSQAKEPPPLAPQEKPALIAPNFCAPKASSSYFTSVDFLYWNARITAYAPTFHKTNDSVQFSGNVLTENIGKVENLQRLWRPGFRVGIGQNYETSHWDVHFLWTYFYSKTLKDRQTNVPLIDGSNNPPASGASTQEGFPGDFWGDANSFFTYQATWRLNYNILDLELGRPYPLSSACSFRPFWGVRNGWIRQHFVNTFRFSKNANPPETGRRQIGTSLFWGIGPRVGCMMDWFFYRDLSIIGNLSCSALYGTSKGRTIDNIINPGQDERTEINTSDSFQQITPSAQFSLGLKWSYCFSEETKRVNLSASWEINHYWNQLQLSTSIDGNTSLGAIEAATLINQPLTLKGVTGNLSFDF